MSFSVKKMTKKRTEVVDSFQDSEFHKVVAVEVAEVCDVSIVAETAALN